MNTENNNDVPSRFELEGNFPNPLYSRTTIRYKLRTRSTVRFVLVNSLGELIQEHTIGIQGPGVQSFQFDGQSLASGVYVYTISTSEYVQKGRMVIVK